jgi:putative ABC transport system permease protein
VGAAPADDELAAELESHLQMHTDDNLRSGMTPEQARRNAILKLGGLEQTKQAYRERNTIPFIEALLTDVRYALRQLLRSPGFAITAILLITIGIGANAAIFTLVDFVLVRPLPFPEPERLIKVWEKHPGYSMMELSPANYRDLKAANTSFAALAAYNGNSMNLVGQGEPQRIEGASVTGNLFSTLGRPALIGRYFSEDDDKAGAPGTVVLSYALWQLEFEGDGSVVGKSIFLDNSPYTVIGIMPPDFRFPSRETQFWTTFKFQEGDYQDRDNNYLVGIGRLKPGVSLAEARSELMLIAARLQRQYPKENQGVDVSAIGLRDELSTQSQFLLKALCGAAFCVLVITCANLANLLLTRSLARQKELSIRLSLGAHRHHIVRQFLSESLLLGVAGGASAIGVATAALPLLSRLVPNSLPTQQIPPVDLRVLLFALSLTLTIVILFGVAPALWACRTAGFGGLRVGVRTGGAGHRLRSVLVIAEVAVSVVLLISSGLLIRALWKVQSTDPGFRTNNILTLHTELPFPKYDQTSVRAQFYGKVLTDVRRLPGVTDAAYITALPMEWRGGIWAVAVGGRDQIRTEGNSASGRFVTPGFFATLGIPIQSGRDFSETDTADRPYVAVVSESFVRRYWPHEQPIGQHFGFALHDREIVGVVGDIRVRGLERTSEPQVYLGYKQVPDGMLPWYSPKDLVIHSSQAPQSLLPGIRQIIRAADAEQPVSNVRTMEEIVGGETESRAIQMRVLIAFTAVAIVLAGLGIYGLLSFVVSMRQQEFAFAWLSALAKATSLKWY